MCAQVRRRGHFSHCQLEGAYLAKKKFLKNQGKPLQPFAKCMHVENSYSDCIAIIYKLFQKCFLPWKKCCSRAAKSVKKHTKSAFISV